VRSKLYSYCIHTVLLLYCYCTHHTPIVIVLKARACEIEAYEATRREQEWREGAAVRYALYMMYYTACTVHDALYGMHCTPTVLILYSYPTLLIPHSTGTAVMVGSDGQHFTERR
jgi:hypothetical protein